MSKQNKKKADQLGMPHGTASGRLRKSILFNLLKKYSLNVCFQCGNLIVSVDDLSIEHKIPWLDSHDPVKLFFDLDNIAFSHFSCNVSAARKTNKQNPCPSLASYNRGCRCQDCIDIHRKYKCLHKRKQRAAKLDSGQVG